jgi:hypothetical protein
LKTIVNLFPFSTDTDDTENPGAVATTLIVETTAADAGALDITLFVLLVFGIDVADVSTGVSGIGIRGSQDFVLS